MLIRVPWSVTFVKRLCANVSVPSALRIRAAVVREGRGLTRQQTIRLRIKRPVRANVWVRERGTDLSTFREVMVADIYRTIMERIEDCQYAMDLGGNIGLTSLRFGHRYPQCQILTVEPCAENRAVMERNLAPLIRESRCQICAGAAWSEDTTLDLGAPPNGTGFDAIQVKAADSSSIADPVAAYSIPTLMKIGGFPRIDILKVDVEGAESEIFNRATGWLEKVNGIAIEFHGNSREVSGFDSVVRDAGLIIEEDRFPHCVVAYRPARERVT